MVHAAPHGAIGIPVLIRSPRRAAVKSSLSFRASIVALLVSAVACETTAPRDGVNVSVRLSRLDAPVLVTTPAGERRLGCDAHFEVTAAGKGTASFVDGSVAFFAGTDRSRPQATLQLAASQLGAMFGQPYVAPGDQLEASMFLVAGMPYHATFRVTVQDQRATASDTLGFDCGPVVTSQSPLPVVSSVALTTVKPQIEPGDTVTVRFTVTSVGLWSSRVSLAGPCPLSEVVDGKLGTAESDSARFAIPANCALGTPISVTVEATDAGARTVGRTIDTGRPVVDVTPPSVDPRLIVPADTTTNFAGAYGGDSALSVMFNARDNAGVAWLVWQVLPFNVRDSVPATTAPVRIPLDASWAGRFQLRLSARDIVGNESASFVTPLDSMALYPRVARLTTTAGIPAAPGKIVIAPDHSMLYAMYASPDVVVLPTATMQPGTPIRLPGVPSSIDLSASGDTLVAVIPSQRALALVDVRRAPGVASLEPITGLDTLSNETLVSVAVLADGHALVTTRSGLGAGMLEVDLAAGTQRRRTDFVPRFTSTVDCRLYPSLDRRVAYTDDNCPSRFDLAADGFTTFAQVAPYFDPHPDGDGMRLSQRGEVYDSIWQRIADIDDRPSAGYSRGSALSVDGATLYTTRFDGLVSWRVSDQTAIDRSPLPTFAGFGGTPTGVLMAPDGALLIAYGTTYGPLSQCTVMAIALR